MPDGLERVFWVLAIGGTTIFVLKLVVLMTGGGHGDSDASHGGLNDADGGEPGHDAGGHHGSNWAFQFLTMQALATFAMGAGWMGLAAPERLTVNEGQTVAAAALFGVGLVVLMTKLMSKLRTLESSGTLNMKNAVGQTGVVYLTLPSSGAGQIEVVVQGRLCTLDAVSRGAAVPTGAKVRVEAVDAAGRLVVVAI